MINLGPVFRGEKSQEEVLKDVGIAQLRDEVHEITNKLLDIISDSIDEDVVFYPSDPDAHDPYAENEKEINIAWTLGHVVVHLTASSEEKAFIAAEMARGISRDGRSRYEIPWQTVTTIEQCRDRLAESRKMLLASLEMWPDPPHMNIKRRPWSSAPELNPIAYFLSGLRHARSHVGQVKKIVQQAEAARIGTMAN